MGLLKKMSTDINQLKNLFIVGAPRSATTLISTTLGQNSSYNPSYPNETLYFLDSNVSEQFYNQKFFKKDVGIKIDSSPQYFLYPDLILKNIEKVYKKNECKFIIVIRDPFERLTSHYNYFKNLGNEEKSFEDALNDEIGQIYSGGKIIYPSIPNSINGYILNSLYTFPITRWKKLLKNDQILILNFKDLNEDFDQYFDTIDAFCGLSKFNYEKFYVNSAQNMGFIQKLFFKDSFLKTITKPLIPRKIRMDIKEFIKLLNSKKNIEKSDKNLLKKKIPKIAKEIISSDYKKLKTILNFN